jgi:hypothetical protein
MDVRAAAQPGQVLRPRAQINPQKRTGGIAMERMRRCWLFGGALALLLVFALTSGCATWNKWRQGDAGLETEDEAMEGPPTPEPVYYDFDDVLVPQELEVDSDKSFVYEAPDFKAGILTLSGRVETDSLITFFQNNMAKDNWRLVSAFKSPRTILFFNKPNRSCIINITERQFKVEVEIWVAPTIDKVQTVSE